MLYKIKEFIEWLFNDLLLLRRVLLVVIVWRLVLQHHWFMEQSTLSTEQVEVLKAYLNLLAIALAAVPVLEFSANYIERRRKARQGE